MPKPAVVPPRTPLKSHHIQARLDSVVKGMITHNRSRWILWVTYFLEALESHFSTKVQRDDFILEVLQAVQSRYNLGRW